MTMPAPRTSTKWCIGSLLGALVCAFAALTSIRAGSLMPDLFTPGFLVFGAFAILWTLLLALLLIYRISVWCAHAISAADAAIERAAGAPPTPHSTEKEFSP